MKNSRWFKATVFGLTLGVAAGLTACTSESPNGAGSLSGAFGQTKTAPAAMNVSVEPGDGSKDVSPGGPIRITVTDGSIGTVKLTNAGGKAVNGQLSEDKKTWTTAEPLGYGKTYTWSGTAVGAGGEQKPISGSFTTVQPKRLNGGKLNISDGKTYGIAMPISVTFDAPVTDKAAVERALTVRTSVPTEGAWAWLSNSVVHWRPKEYWKPGTQVTLTAKLYGTSFGNGVYGDADLSAHFTIGRAQIVTANTQTHRLIVTRDGQQVADYPASYGLESDPGRVTKNGIHVVMEKYETKLMTNQRYNYENVPVPWAVRISNNGEFIHGYQKSVPDQGKRNVSHGCANLSPANAKAYYETAMTGDPVEVVGSSIPLSAADNDYYDWAIPWDQWAAKSALV